MDVSCSLACFHPSVGGRAHAGEQGAGSCDDAADGAFCTAVVGVHSGRGEQADDAVVAAVGVECAALVLRGAVCFQGAETASMRKNMHFTKIFERKKSITFGLEREEHDEASDFVHRDRSVGMPVGGQRKHWPEHVHGEALEGLEVDCWKFRAKAGRLALEF